MNKLTFIIIVCVLIVGCALPIPHRRLHVYGVKSKVVDNDTNEPIQGATICSFPNENIFTKSDKWGVFELPPIYGWHGGYFIGPVSTSFWPGFDIAAPNREIIVKSTGYRNTKMSIESEEPLKDDFIIIDEIRINK